MRARAAHVIAIEPSERFVFSVQTRPSLVTGASTSMSGAAIPEHITDQRWTWALTLYRSAVTILVYSGINLNVRRLSSELTGWIWQSGLAHVRLITSPMKAALRARR
jgi:hypothetical protein